MAEISLHEYCEQIENTIEQGRYEEAVAHGKHILRQYPKHITTYQLLGQAMLESGQGEYAADMFRRVLSADPENLISWIGLSELHRQRSEVDAAAWYLERAFELASDNEIIEEELRTLYGQRDGVEPQRFQLTRGALARLYLKGDLLSRAINELQSLLAEHPERVDLSIMLAEALWRNEQRLEASTVCQELLDRLPYCIKANLILGEIWTSGGREEGQTYLRRAAALDPENRMAQEFLGDISPLLAREVRIAPLEYAPSTLEERPAWMAEAEVIPAEAPPPTEEETALADITSALETQIEIPSWLEEVVGEEAPTPTTVPPAPTAAESLTEPLLEELISEEEITPAPADEVPDWLAGIGEESIAEKPEAVAMMEEETPEWLSRLGLEPTVEEGEEEAPVQPAELRVEPTGVVGAPIALGEAETPDWLADLDMETVGEEAPSPTPSAEQPPDWLTGIRDQFTEEVEPPHEAIAEVEMMEVVEMMDMEAEVEEELIPTPAWLEEEGMPSGDEALAWLEQLTAGKEEELQAQAQVEADARLAEIMGRPAPAEPSPAPVEEVSPVVEEPPVAVPPPAPAEIPDWMQELAPSEAAIPEAAPPVAAAAPEEAAFGEPEAPPEAIAEVEMMEVVEMMDMEAEVEEELIPTPAWLEEEGMPSGDEALAWLEQLTAGKEEELQAQAQVEADARLAEIMGRPAPAEPSPAPVEEVSPVVEEPPVAMPPPAPAEIPDWMQELAPSEAAIPEVAPPAAAAAPEEAAFGEPEAPPEAIAEVEMAPPVEEIIPPAMPEPAYLEEPEFPPKAIAEVAPPEEAEKEITPSPVVEVEMPEPLELEEEEEVVPAVPKAPAVEVPTDPLAAKQAYLKSHPRDYETWLVLARALWQDGQRQEALEAYAQLIRSGQLLENVVPDLETCLEQWPDVSMQRVLGDAYMKDGQLQEALDIYRQALETL
ncbi:MAG: tetratricopeptide repeat protein [Chloroflexota bacterium]|nr:tetratricopeptide repeat protein [Chloroflexota bacterium]